MSNALKLATRGFDAPRTLYQIISDAGLTSGLKLCLDAGDSASYNPSVQTAKWLDVSGNGEDFYRGDSTAGDVYEPAFNGSAGGISSSEYFSQGGNDYFQYDQSTNPTWINNLHKAGAKFTAVFTLQLSQTTSQFVICATSNPTASFGGIWFAVNANTRRIYFQAFNGASAARTVTATATTEFVDNAWVIFMLSVDEAANQAQLRVNNGTRSNVACSYTSPTTTNAHFQMHLFAKNAAASQPAPTGSRMAQVAFWEGTALTLDQLTNLYSSMKGRFGL